MYPSRWSLALVLALPACGPIVADETPSAGESSGGVQGTSSGAGPSEPGSECVVGAERVCDCPEGGFGVQRCEAGGVLGPCLCAPPSASTGGWGTTDATFGETGAPSSTGAPVEPGGCLPLDQPCEGDIMLEVIEDIDAVSQCSRIEGSFIIRYAIRDPEPFQCLRELGNQLLVDHTTMSSLAALSNLERIEGELEVLSSQVTALDLDALVHVGYFSLNENPQLGTLGLPNLQTIEFGLDVTDNPQLPTCELEALANTVVAPDATVYYVGNADDGCPSTR